MPNVIMKGRDAVSARKAQCFVTISGRRYEFANIIDLEAIIDKNKVEVPRLNATMRAHKTIDLNGTFSGTMHYNQSIMRKLISEYKNTGIDTYFDIQATNDDPETSLGRQTVSLFGCNLDNTTLFKMDADGEYLEEPIEGTFEDFSIPEEFQNDWL